MDDEETVVYPPGCYALSNNMDTTDLIRGLMMIAKSFQGMNEASISDYGNLALFLSSPFLIFHNNDDVRLLAGYSVAQFLHKSEIGVSYPSSKLMQIFEFLFDQLKILRSSIKQKRSFCEKILQILVKEEISQLYYKIEDSQTLLISLMHTISNTVQVNMSIVIQDMLGILVGILLHGLPQVPDQFIRMLFYNFKDKNKASNRAAYEFTVRLIRKHTDILAPAIGKLLVTELFGTFLLERSFGSSLDEKQNKLPTHWLSRLWKLHAICSEVATPVMLRLESALMTPNVNHRLVLIRFLARLFSTPCQVPAHKEYFSLWKAFLGRFNDENPDVRMACIEQMDLLFKIKDLREDLLWILSQREFDPVTKIRIAIIEVVSLLIQSYASIANSALEDLFSILEQKRLDIEVAVRIEAIEKMGEVFYFLHEIERSEIQEEYSYALKRVAKYPKYILLNFWINPPHWMEDRLAVIHQLHKHLVPIRMEPEARMKRLIKMWISFDAHTCTTLTEIRYIQNMIREHLMDVISYLKKSKGSHSQEERHAILSALAISHSLPIAEEPAFRIVMSFALKVKNSEQHLQIAETILCGTSCEETIQAMVTLLNDLKLPPAFQILLDLVADLLMDKHSLKIVVEELDDLLQGNLSLFEKMDVDVSSTIGKIFHLLQGVSSSSPSYFGDEEVMQFMISWLQMPETDLQINTLKLLANMKPQQISLEEEFPEVVQELISVCEESCNELNVRLAKWIVRSLNAVNVDIETIRSSFLVVFEAFSSHITSKEISKIYECIIFLGYILYHFGKYFESEINYLISDKIITEVMCLTVNEMDETCTWNSFESLPIEIRTKIKFIKLLGQCLNTVKSVSVSKILDVLFRIIQGESFNSDGSLLSLQEKAFLRLAAACSVLQVLMGRPLSILTCNQFYQLSELMNDEVPFVRQKFIQKFTSKMMKEYPQKSLPLGLLGFYMLINAKESDFSSEMKILFSRRLSAFANFKKVTLGPENFEMDDHVLVYGLLVSANNKKFSDHQNFEQLNMIKQKMIVFLNALSCTQDNFLFYQKQIQLVKNKAIKGGDRNVNLNLWTLCDLAVMIVKVKIKRNELTSKEEPTLPTEFFISLPKKNNQKFLTKTMLAQLLPASRVEEESETASSDLEEEEELSEVEKTVVVGSGVMTIEDASRVDWEDPQRIQQEGSIAHKRGWEEDSTGSRRRRRRKK